MSNDMSNAYLMEQLGAIPGASTLSVQVSSIPRIIGLDRLAHNGVNCQMTPIIIGPGQVYWANTQLWANCTLWLSELATSTALSVTLARSYSGRGRAV